MIRMLWVVITSIPYILYYVNKAKLIERFFGRYPEEKRYRMALRCIRIIKRHGAIRTASSGQEKLPEEGGYVMFPNHQGKYDTLGIMYAHPKPCTILMDFQRSKLPIVDPFMDLLNGKRIDKTDMRNQVRTISEIADEVSRGRKYIVFPEGGYDHNGNDLQEFMPGAFKCATKAKVPIVPVLIIDSYKAFNSHNFKPIKTQVHFLDPICYEEYKEMSTKQIAELVKNRIEEEMNKRV